MKNKNNGIIVLAMTLVMVFMMSSAVFATSWTYQDRITVQTGEPVYIVWDASPATTGTLAAVNNSYYPEDFVLWVGDGSVPTVSSGTATLVQESTGLLDDGVTEVTNKAYQIHLTGSGTVKVTIDNVEYTLSNSAPNGTPTVEKPTVFNGFLPVGQFATGVGWGSIFKNKTNLNGTVYKFLSGYCSPGVSLGAAGGYIDYDFYANNASSHPYGVDFIVYGNAFSGNPEAGAVKVFGYTQATGGTGAWYDLAGSLYYQSPSMHHKDVSWKLESSNLYYSVTDNGTAPSTWSLFKSSCAGWWPFNTNKGYESINNMGSNAFSSDDVSVLADRSQLTYKDVCIVEDSDTTNDYQFGYFDVHNNGASYGTAVNPYTITNSDSGGDGFDLSCAVDSDGEPVKLDHITKVRLYTAAALNSAGTGFDTTLTFGETSAEVCAVFGVDGTSGSGASNKVTIMNGSDPIRNSDLGCKTVNLNGSGSITLSFTTAATNMFINGESKSSGYSNTYYVNSGSTKYIQIITQTNTESPYLTVLKIVG